MREEVLMDILLKKSLGNGHKMQSTMLLSGNIYKISATRACEAELPCAVVLHPAIRSVTPELPQE